MNMMIKSFKSCEAERALWCAVLAGALHDLTCEPEHLLHRPKAIAWLGAYPTGPFKAVCRSAGFEPEAVWPRLKRLCDPERAKD